MAGPVGWTDGASERAVAASGADPLLERDDELSTLDALISRAARGDAGLALVEGSAGIGKTRLVGEAKRRAIAAGFRVVGARGADMEHEFPFGVVRQLFEAAVAADPHLLSGAALAARPIFDPVVDGTDTADRSFAALHGLYWLTVNLAAATPLLLTVDDLHWCDRASVRFIAYLVRRLEGLPVLVVCSVRPSWTATDDALLGELASDPVSVSIRPRPLGAAAVARLVGDGLRGEPAAAFVDVCLTATGGNPLLLRELLRTLAAEGVRPDAASLDLVRNLGPRAVSRAVFLRLARLPREAIRLANALAVLGDGTDLARLAALADISEPVSAQHISLLARAEIMRGDLPFGFVHPLVGSAIYEDIPPADRALQHAKAAKLLAAVDAPIEQIAAQLLSAPAHGEAWAVDALRRAARSALSQGAADSAVALLTRAAAEQSAEPPHATVLVELGRAEALTNGPAAVEHLAAGYSELADPAARATAAQALARALLFTGYPDDGAAVARTAAAELSAEHADLRQTLEAFELLAVLFGAGDRSAMRRLEAYRTVPVGPGIGAKMLAAIAAQHWIYECGPSAACVQLSLDALAGGDLIAADNGLLATCAITNLVFADHDSAMYWWDRARADAHARGSLFAISSLSLWFGYSLWWRGDLLDAEESLRTARHQLELWNYADEQAQIYCDAFLAAALREQGDLQGARIALERSNDPGGADDGARYWLNSTIELLLAEERYAEAIVAVAEYERRFATGIRNPMDAPWRSHKAVALTALGRRDEARSYAEDESALARRWGGPSTVARSLRVLALVSPEHEVEHLSAAVAAVSRSSAKLETAKSLVALGSALRRQRRPRDARDSLREALEIAQACGAHTLAGRARAELHAAGGRPRATSATGVSALSASERRVAALAADGATNRDIAQALFVTPKTVEAHLSSVYRKLGIRSRHELPTTIGTDP